MNKLWLKLAAAFFLVVLLTVSVIAIVANRATSIGFQRFLDEDQADQAASVVNDLAAYYADYGSWSGVENVLRDYLPGRGGGGGGATLIVIDGQGDVAATAGSGRGRARPEADQQEALPIMVGGQQVGGLIIDQPGMMSGAPAQQYLESVNQALVYTTIIALLLALILGAFLARSLTKPLGDLTRATKAVAAGDLEQRVAPRSKDEIGELAVSFNQMAAALTSNEVQRQQLFADLAHELRTPISVIRGQLEGMQDGIFERTDENLATVHEETILLGRLVEDLRTLSLAESGQLPLKKEQIDLSQQAMQAVTAIEPLAEAEGVRLEISFEHHVRMVLADSARIQQVFSNLLSNALRHASQGHDGDPLITVAVEGRERIARASVRDNGPGLPKEAQEHVFDRFWRADSARSRDQGGSGLGLAICKGIVEAHGGRIWVESAPGEGAAFIFELPLML